MTGAEVGDLTGEIANRSKDVCRTVTVWITTSSRHARRRQQLKLSRQRIRVAVNLHRVTAEEEAAGEADDHRRLAEKDEEEDNSRSRF